MFSANIGATGVVRGRATAGGIGCGNVALTRDAGLGCGGGTGRGVVEAAEDGGAGATAAFGVGSDSAGRICDGGVAGKGRTAGVDAAVAVSVGAASPGDLDCREADIAADGVDGNAGALVVVTSARSRVAEVGAAPRTICDSTTTSFGPPIIRRCSTLSRRTRTSCLCPSSEKASTTPKRG